MNKMGPVQQKIYDKLSAVFQPDIIEITNDSGRHAKHKGFKEMDAANPETAANADESHLRLFIKSAKFNGVSKLNRQRMILDELKDEMQIIHALAIKAIGADE